MDWTEEANNYLKLWFQGQKTLAASQREMFGTFAKHMREAAADLPDTESLSLAKDSEKLTETARNAAAMWQSYLASCATLAEVLPTAGADDAAQTALGKLIDPSQLVGAGMDEIGKTIQRLTEGPEFADLGNLHGKLMKTMSAWLEMRRCGGEYQVVVMGAWMAAFQRLMAALKEKGNKGEAVESWQQLTDLWLAIANDTLLEAHRSDPFLEAQSQLLRAGTRYRLLEREITEFICEAKSVPTRTEVDDLHRTVHALRREVREMKRGRARPLDSNSDGAPAAKEKSRAPTAGKDTSDAERSRKRSKRRKGTA